MPPRTVSAGRLFAVAIAIVTAACSREGDARKVPLSQASVMDSARAVEGAHGLLGPAAKAALDRGNALFRKSQFAEALTEYRAAATLAPQHAAPLFGIYMVGRATNNTALADSALAGIRSRGGSMLPAPHAFADTALQRIHQSLRKNPSSS